MEPASLKTTGVIGRYFAPPGGQQRQAGTHTAFAELSENLVLPNGLAGHAGRFILRSSAWKRGFPRRQSQPGSLTS